MRLRGSTWWSAWCSRGFTRWAARIAATSCAAPSVSIRSPAAASAVNSTASISAMCRVASTSISASLSGKYWYSDPMLTPARSAIALVVAASGPWRARI